ncbi:nuclear transport factor 2 family protein [Streptomyces zagrosensis]|uniref:Ketosteroid isomerase-like protein n=1 Tax=Streptomyces zagrosensis TaxID=1042984 RepID=A0A7W9UY34_9ACTN|nr:nuclear transport factor 2 family protein [Streptomyces zagrosensis]MBB5935505.1 ketosteroid isomerase-like protein [Streptomyces zagrosensis]
MPSDVSRSSARPGGSATDLAAVWAVFTDMYEAYLAGDRARIDAHLDPEATVWDSATPQLLLGKPALDQVRAQRPAAERAGGGPVEAGLTAYDQVIDVFGELAVCRHWLRIDYRDRPSGLLRNTAVLRRAHGGWLITHLHEDGQAAD